MATCIITTGADRPRRDPRCNAGAARPAPAGIQLSATKKATGQGRFQTVVFRQVPRTEDFEQSRTERLPGATSKDAAWEKLYAALRRDRALIGGSVEEVL